MQDLTHALTILTEAAERPRKYDVDVWEALCTVRSYGAHPVSCAEFWRISAWPSDMRPERSLTWHMGQIWEATMRGADEHRQE